MNFLDLGISAALFGALEKEGITSPMPIQTEAIPPLLAGKDAYVSAETGTGKTLAYLLPIFSAVDQGIQNAQAMVLAPTHELASQIHQQALRLAQNSGMPIKSLLLIGGASTKRQVEKLKKKPQLIVGSTGRVLELIRMKKLKVPAVKTLVIDEVDRMLFGESLAGVQDLLGLLPKKPQLIFVSATEQAASSAEAKSIAPDLELLSAAANQINPDIQHLFLVIDERNKADTLRGLLHAVKPERAIVFVHRNNEAEQVKAKMEYYGIAVADLHGAHGKLDRKKAMDDFRSGKRKVLIASDVAARGLDIKGVTHIFNYDVPSNSKDYLHRAGRTGRAGSAGYAVSLMTPNETRLADRYESELGIEMIEATLHGGQLFAAEEG